MNLKQGEIIEINIGSEKCEIITEKKIYFENVSWRAVCCVGEKYDIEYKNSIIRDVYSKRCIGIGNNKYEMLEDYVIKEQ